LLNPKTDWSAKLRTKRESVNATSRGYYLKMLGPDHYCKARLLEIEVGRRFWQSKSAAADAHAFYLQVVKPLRRLQRWGVVEKVQEVPAPDEGTPIAVEIVGRVDLTNVSKQ
jgi:hypothetical protein